MATKRHLLVNRVILFLSFTIFSCSSSESIPWDYGECHYPLNNDNDQYGSNFNPVNQGAIYLDLSTSMKGYISDAKTSIPFTLLQHLLRSFLITAFHQVDISKTAFFGFNREIVKSNAPMVYYAIQSPDGTQPRARFDRGETNIIQVFLSAAKEPSSLSVIITDGLQDVSGINGELAPGFDLPEFTDAVNDSLISKGFGIWLLGIMNDFDGYYYNIIPDKQGRINKPIRISRSKRPVYCWVIGKDISKGRSFMKYLSESLQVLANADDRGKDKLINIIEIAPGITPTLSLSEYTAGQSLENTVQILDWRKHPDVSTTTNVCADFPSVAGASVDLTIQGDIKYSDTSPSWNTLPVSIWAVKVPKPEAFPVAITIDGVPTENADSDSLRKINFKFDYDKLIVFDPAERLKEFPSYVYADLQNGLEDHWVKKWSTNLDTDKGAIRGKTLYLYDVVRAMLENTIGKQRVGACIHLSLIKRGS